MIALLRRSVCGGGVDGGWCCFVCVGVDDGGVQNANGKFATEKLAAVNAKHPNTQQQL